MRKATLERFAVEALNTWSSKGLQVRNDAAGVAGFLGDLTYIYQETSDVKYADAVMRTVLKVDGRPGPAAESYKWRQFDRVGVAKIGGSYSDDAPTVEIRGAEQQTRIIPVRSAFEYTIQDLRASQMMGIPLEIKKAEIARRSIENAFDLVMLYGDAAPGYADANGNMGLVGTAPLGQPNDPLRVYGLNNVPNTINVGDPNLLGTGAGSLLNAKTGTFQTSLNWTLDSTPVSAILADVNAMQRTMVQFSVNVHQPDTWLLGTAVMWKLATAARSSTFTDDVILQFIQKQSPWIKRVVYVPTLDTAGLKQDNATAGPRTFLLDTNGGDLSAIVGQEFEMFPPTITGMKFRVECHARIGGIKAPYGRAVAWLDGTAG